MYSAIPQGNQTNIQGLICNLPPEGYIWNILTNQLEFIGIHKRSNIESEQYWERFTLPKWYKEVAKKWDEYDEKRKPEDVEFYDERLEKYKQQEWSRRLNGYWFYNNGKATYITGAHYMFMQWWLIDIGYPKFRIPDLEYFYFLQYCIEDPNCMGMLEITKRRFGKTFRGGLFLYEYITRTKMTNAGIQSKTGQDAKKVFAKAVINPFIKLPKFFRPEYDMGGGLRPKSALVFQQTNVRGKKAELNLVKDELGSMIDHEDASIVAYDGQKLHRYFADEWAKCFGKGTKIRMYDGAVKNIEDIENGEYVMGDDSTPRKTFGKTKGVEMMYKIIPNKGETFICNASHILTLSASDNFKLNNVQYKTGDIINITVKEFIELKDWMKKCLALYRTGWELPAKDHLINPYMFGVWLGDGSSRDFSITSIDNEIINSISHFANEQNLSIRKKEDNISYHVTSNKVGVNHITKELRRLNVLKNKHIPDEYLIDSRENRLQLLAGLIDTDGYSIRRGDMVCGIEITQKRHDLAKNIHELIISLGFYCSIIKNRATMKRGDGSIYSCDIYKLRFYGDIDLIPIKIKRKIPFVSRTKNRRNPLKSGFSVERIGEGEYYGIAVDRNHLFLLADGTVVHNTVEVNIYDRHEVIRYCLMDDEGNIIGKTLYSSTVEKLDTDKDGVQEAAKLLWDESDQLSKGENGRTSSGLYRFFMTADRAKNFDIYGYPDIEKTIKSILADRETVKNNPNALAARTRKEARTIEEAWLSDNEKCIFNITHLNLREAELRDNPIPKRSVVFYRDFETQNVAWRDVDATKSDFHWEISPDLPLNNKDANKFTTEYELKKPANIHVGSISVDSYSNSQGGRKYGSKASAWIWLRFNIDNPTKTGKAVGHLFGRPKVKDELHEQVMLAAEYLGFEVHYELVADDYEGYFRERGKILYLGLTPFCFIEPKERKNPNLQRLRGVPTTPFSLTTQHDSGISYVQFNYHKIDFPVLIPNLRNFDPYNRTKFDAAVSWMIGGAAITEHIIKPPPKKTPIIQVFNSSNSNETEYVGADVGWN